MVHVVTGTVEQVVMSTLHNKVANSRILFIFTVILLLSTRYSKQEHVGDNNIRDKDGMMQMCSSRKSWSKHSGHFLHDE